MPQLHHYLDLIRLRRPSWLTDASVIYISNENGVDQLWRKDKGQAPYPLTDNNQFIADYVVDENNAVVYFTLSEGGGEKFQIYALKNGKISKISQANDMVNYLGSVRNKGNELIYTNNQRDFANFDLISYNAKHDSHHILWENYDNYNFPMAISPNDRYFIYQKLFSEENQPLWLYDFNKQAAFPLFDLPATYDKPVWKQDSSGFYFLTNLNHDFMYVAEYQLATKTYQPLLTFSWDVENLALSPDGRYLAVIINEHGYSQLKIYHTSDMSEVPIAKQPKGVIAYYDLLTWSPSSKHLLFTFSSGSQPDKVMFYSLDDEKFHVMIENHLHPVVKELTVEPELRYYSSFDGLQIPYWLYIPQKFDRLPENGLPLVIEIHGGPEAQERAAFNEYIQYHLANGIAVAAPNVRGSTGYGKTYTQLDNIEKRLDSVKDIAYLAQNLITNNLADKHKIVVSGTSYGGFMALSCAGRYPDLFCGVVDNVGMFNLVTFLENTSSYRRAHRESEYGSLATHRDVLYEISPVSVVDNMTGPLMVIHGANDARVPVSEAEQVVAYLRERKIGVTYLRYEDEGHGLQKRQNKLNCYPQVIAFIKKCMNLT